MPRLKRPRFSPDAPDPLPQTYPRKKYYRNQNTHYMAQLSHNWNVLLSLELDQKNPEKKATRSARRIRTSYLPVVALDEIFHYQYRNVGSIIPLDEFKSVADKILSKVTSKDTSFEVPALHALQITAEAFLCDLFSAAGVCANTLYKQVTIEPKQLKICAQEYEMQESRKRLASETLTLLPLDLVSVILAYL